MHFSDVLRSRRDVYCGRLRSVADDEYHLQRQIDQIEAAITETEAELHKVTLSDSELGNQLSVQDVELDASDDALFG